MRPKLAHNISGLFRVLEHDSDTIVIQRGEVFERASRDRVTLVPKQAITRAARIGDAQPKHLQAKRTSGRSYTFSKILGHRELQSGDLEFKILWDATVSQHGNPATVSQRKQYRATSRDTGANVTRASSTHALVTTSMARTEHAPLIAATRNNAKPTWATIRGHHLRGAHDARPDPW